MRESFSEPKSGVYCLLAVGSDSSLASAFFSGARASQPNGGREASWSCCANNTNDSLQLSYLAQLFSLIVFTIRWMEMVIVARHDAAGEVMRKARRGSAPSRVSFPGKRTAKTQALGPDAAPDTGAAI